MPCLEPPSPSGTRSRRTREILEKFSSGKGQRPVASLPRAGCRASTTVDSGHQPPARASARASPPPPATAHHASRRHRPAREPRVAVELRGWGKPKQDVLIDDHETTGLRIVFRQWPVGYDPLSKGEKPYQTPAPSDNLRRAVY